MLRIARRNLAYLKRFSDEETGLTSKRQGQRSVLVVEDDPGLLATLEFNLEATGYDVFTASDGATALDIRRSNRVELVILDLSLPVMGGMQVCKALRDSGDTVPIIMLTAWDQENQRVEGLRSGADDYVVKPFSLSELMARVEAQLRRASMFNEASVRGGGGGHTIGSRGLGDRSGASECGDGWLRS